MLVIVDYNYFWHIQAKMNKFNPLLSYRRSGIIATLTVSVSLDEFTLSVIPACVFLEINTVC